MDSVAAKQFLISKVIGEAEFEHVPLSEVEKKMLHFTEEHPTLPDIYEVNEEFERTCDNDEYETKISKLLKSARGRDQKESPSQEQQWKDALDALRKEDHYILIMVGEAFGWSPDLDGEKHRVRDYLIYIAIGIAVALVAIALGILGALMK